jgi:DICT domain-containing protein
MLLTDVRNVSPSIMKGISISDVAERTGLAAATIRMWEHRYGFPAPARDALGYRQYTDEDVEILRRVMALREGGLSVSASLARARERSGATDRPSLFGVVAGSDAPLRPRTLRKATLLAVSRALEDEALARAAAPVVFAAFQHEHNYRAVEHRYRRLARMGDAAAVFADFPALRMPPGGPAEVPISQDESIGSEWAVVIDAPGYAACLLAWEDPDWEAAPGLPDLERRFETVWTGDPRVVRRAAKAGAALAARADARLGSELDELLTDRPPRVRLGPPARRDAGRA